MAGAQTAPAATPAQAPAPASGKATTVQIKIRSPKDLLLVAKIFHDGKNYAGARKLAAAAYKGAKAAGDREVQYNAALISADSAAALQAYTSAKVWLRRADEAAGTDQQHAVVAKLYKVIAARDPLSVSLGFSVSPSNNVNNGAENTIIEIAGLPFSLSDSAQQLGGYVADASAAVSYRIAQSKRQQTSVIAQVFQRKVWLNADAKNKAPDAKGSDFDQAQALLGLRRAQIIWPALGPTEASAFVGKTWYGNELYSTWTQYGLGQTFRQGNAASLGVALTWRDENNAVSPISDAYIRSASVTYDRRAKTDHGYAIQGYVRDSRSDSATVDYLGRGASATFELGRLAAARPAIRLSGEYQDYRKWVVTPGGRHDRTFGVGLSFGFPGQSVYGFEPYVVFNARRVFSDVDIYSRNEYSAAFNFRSRL